MSSEKPENKTLRVGVPDIETALKEGNPITCATCVHFFEARAKGLDTCGKTLCGGPIIGRDFPEYKGQIPRNKFSEICLLCGSGILYCHMVVPGKDQRFGLCLAHKDALNGIITNPEIHLTQTTPIIIPLP